MLFAGLARVAGKCASLLESCGPCCAEGPTLIVLWVFSFRAHWLIHVWSWRLPGFDEKTGRGRGIQKTKTTN